MTWDSVAHLMTDMSQAVFGMADLHDLIATGQMDLIEKRLEVVDLSRSVARAMLIDSEKESFERKPTPLTGVPDLLDRFMIRMSAAAGMPVTLLFGRSPAGMNATGESDTRAWYNRVEALQGNSLRPRLKRLFRWLLTEGGAREPDAWDVHFKPLWTPTAKESAEIRHLQAQTDAAYLKEGVVFAEEVALSRFTAQGWSEETELVDPEQRRQLLEAEQDRALEMAENPPPEPEPEPLEDDPIEES